MLLQLSDPWSGWASTLLGGFIGALTVVLGVWLAYRYGEKSRQKQIHENDSRKAEDERRAAAAQLMVEVSNLRDSVSGRRKGLTGTANLWRMRNVLFTTHVYLRKYPSYWIAQDFYDTAYAWRQWVRDMTKATSSEILSEEQYPVVKEYREAMHAYGEKVIQVLQDRLEDPELKYEPPALPSLPSPPS